MRVCTCVCVCDNKDISNEVGVGLLLSLGISQTAPKKAKYTKMQCIIPNGRPCWRKTCPQLATFLVCDRSITKEKT